MTRPARAVRRPVQPVLPLEVPRLPSQARAALAAHIAPGWAAQAACASSRLGPDAWHADPAEPGHTAAKAVCGSCPVRRSCLAHALTSDADEGERAWLQLALTDQVPVSVVLGPTSVAAVA